MHLFGDVNPPIIEEDHAMSGHLNEKQPQAKIRPGKSKRITSDSFKAKMAEGFVTVAKNMETERWK